MYLLNSKIAFPPVDLADEDGFLAIGGDLSTERLLEAYRNGIFPWYNEGEPICWWSPDPRCILYPAALHVSKSMQHVIREETFSFSINEAFDKVIRQCQGARRKETNGTWIHEEMIEAYTRLHNTGHAVSGEAWQDGVLVGGLYGIRMGKIFFGESMFSTVSNASKFAFIQFVRQLQKENVKLIDCQMHTAHLESMGATLIERKLFLEIIRNYCG
jgi:leucyl/phenylalanyl-tRNA--protein transferase